MRTKDSKKCRSAPAGAPNRPVADLPVLSTAEEVVRALENGPDEGLVVLDAGALREGVRILLRHSRAEEEGAAGEEPPRFTPKHLNVLFGNLTKSQQTFLLLLLREPGALVTRAEILGAIRGGDGDEVKRTHSVNQAAHVLRRRLGSAGRCIETVHGVGFRWNREREPRTLSFEFFKVAGLSMVSALALVAGVLWFLRGPADGCAPALPPAGPGTAGTFQAMRAFWSSGSFGEPSASAAHAKGHSPWRSVDGSADTWFEGAAPARAGDWLAFRFPVPLDRSVASARGRRIEILLGRPDPSGAPVAPPCRVECSAGASGAAPETWIPLGSVEPSTGRFVVDAADLPVASVVAIRLVVTADSDLPLAVREAGFADSEPDGDPTPSPAAPARRIP